MSEPTIRDAELRRELGVPPSVDLVGHARELMRVAIPAAVVAVLVALLVFFVRGNSAGTYESSLIAEITTSDETTGTDATLGQLIAPYVALSEDSGVVAAVAAELGTDPATLGSAFDVGYGSSPTLVTVTARAGSQADADRLAQAVVTQLDRAQTERDRTERLEVLSAPAGSGAKVSPQPAAEAGVAFFGVLVLVAELLVALNGRFGSANTPAWARRVARRYRTAVQVDSAEQAQFPLDTVVMLQQRASLGDSVLVLRGTGVRVDVAMFGPTERITVSGLEQQWWTDTRTEKLALAVIVVRAQAHERVAVEAAMRALAEIDVPVRLVVVGAGKQGLFDLPWQGGSAPGEPESLTPSSHLASPAPVVPQTESVRTPDQHVEPRPAPPAPRPEPGPRPEPYGRAPASSTPMFASTEGGYSEVRYAGDHDSAPRYRPHGEHF